MHPIFLKLGPVTIYSYGLMVALGFIAAVLLACRAAPGLRIAPDRVSTLAAVILISGIIGARILYVILNLKDFLSDPAEIFMIMHGGLVFYGGAIAAILSGAAYLKIKKMSLWDTMDLIAPYAALGHSIGRIGCLLNGCCFGKPVRFFGAIFQDGASRYPTQIFESVYLLLLYIFLRACLKYRQFKAQVFFLYLILYALGRFLIEFFRGDSPVVIAGLTFSQAVSAIIFICGVCGYIVKGRTGKKSWIR